MKLSELKNYVRKIVVEMVEEIIEKKLPEVVMKQIGEVYIRSLVENTVRPGAVSKQRVVESVSEQEEYDPLPAKRTRQTNLQALIPPTGATLKRNSAAATLLAKDNPMRDIYEGTMPMMADDNGMGLGSATDIPLENLDIDMDHIRKLNKRLIGG